MKKPRLSISRGARKDTSTVRSPDESTRGVYEEEIAPTCEQWYKIVTSTGNVGSVHLPDELCDEGTADNLWILLDRKDPMTDPSHLQLVRRKS
jgi:hypothetical protein